MEETIIVISNIISEKKKKKKKAKYRISAYISKRGKIIKIA